MKYWFEMYLSKNVKIYQQRHLEGIDWFLIVSIIYYGLCERIQYIKPAKVKIENKWKLNLCLFFVVEYKYFL